MSEIPKQAATDPHHSVVLNVELVLDIYVSDVTWRALQRGPGGPWPSQNFGWVGHNAFGPTNNLACMFVNSTLWSINSLEN